MRRKTVNSIIITAALIAAVIFNVCGQTTSIGGRFTYTLLPPAFVENPSPSNIYSAAHTSIETGIYGLRYFKGERAGIKVGLEFGLIPWDMGVDAPRNAFGEGTGDGQVHANIGFNDFSYKALTVSAAYKIPLRMRYLEVIAGAGIRDYAFGEGIDAIGFAFNRSIPYDPDDPTHGPPDVIARLEPLDDQFHISFPVSVDYVFRTTKRTQLKIGLMHNIAVKPLSDSELTVIMYGETYKGKFSPRTGFLGFNMQFGYSLKRKPDEINGKEMLSSNIPGKYRKALYVERGGSGVFCTANYDTRLKKDVNHGFGVRAGIGIGKRYYTEVTNNNRGTERRYVSLPVGINYIIGKKRHGMEAGAGFTTQIAFDKAVNDSQFLFMVPLNIGYRFQPIKEGLIARAAWTPVLDKTGFSPLWAGLSLGYSFK